MSSFLYILFLGGFAIVYVARDIQNGEDFALKRLFGSDKDECNNIINEINIHKQVSGHENIVKFIAASFIDRTKNSGRAEYLLVTELCKGGSLYDYLDQAMEAPTVLKIIYQASKAIAHLHAQNINHRDIKIENFLLGADGMLKLCDFGSATKENHTPDITWSTQQRNSLEEILQKFTTPMYRAPEQLDTWNNFPIGISTDVWALGCILFCLCYQKHPFEDGAKLRIINGNYTIPSDSRYLCFNDIIKGCFMVDPNGRLSVSMILERLGAISETKGWSLKGPLELKMKSPIHEATPPQVQHVEEKPTRPPPPVVVETRRNSNSIFYTQNQQQPSQANQAAVAGSGLFSSIKGGAGSFLKNLKESSTKVMQTVQQTMSRTDLDVSFISQRLLIMPCPSEGLESAYKVNHIEDVKLFIEQRFQPSKVSVYNLGVKCARLSPPVRTVECGFLYQPISSRAPILTHMYAIAEDMYGFLNADLKNVIILQSSDNAKSSTMLCALMLYSNLVREPEDAMQMFAVKRAPPNMRPSEVRYSYYLADVLRGHYPHYNPITLVSINLSPIPRMTKARDGCRPYIEICVNDRVAVSTLQDYDRMRLYHASEGKINFPLNITLCGDITITIYHARKGIVGQQQGLKICQMQFHSGYIPEEETLLLYNRNELDDVTDLEHVPNNFCINLSVFIGDDERSPSIPPPWLSAHSKERNPKVLFSSVLEFEENVDNFITKPGSSSENVKKPPPRPAPPAKNPIILDDVVDIATSNESGDPPVLIEPPTTEFDFLRLHSTEEPKISSNIPPPKIKEPSFDLLGGFETSFRDPYPDLIGSALNKPVETLHSSKSAGDLDDFFSSLPQTSAPTIAPNKSSNDLNFAFKDANSTKQAASADPFADLTSSEFSNNAKSQNNQFLGQQNLFTSASTSSIPKSNASTPSHQMKSPNEPHRPDYSRSHFQDPSQQQQQQQGQGQGQGQGQQKGKPADIFGDILGSQGYSFGKTSQGPKSINEMRKVELAQTMDPEKLKVQDWVRIYRFPMKLFIFDFFFCINRQKVSAEIFVLCFVPFTQFYGAMQNGQNVKWLH